MCSSDLDLSVPAEGRSPEGVAFEIETIVRTRREVLLPFTPGEDAMPEDTGRERRRG